MLEYEQSKQHKPEMELINKQHSKTVLTDCISETSNTQVHNAKDLDIVIPIYSLIECIDIQKHLYVYGSIIQMNEAIPSQLLSHLHLNRDC